MLCYTTLKHCRNTTRCWNRTNFYSCIANVAFLRSVKKTRVDWTQHNTTQGPSVLLWTSLLFEQTKNHVLRMCSVGSICMHPHICIHSHTHSLTHTPTRFRVNYTRTVYTTHNVEWKLWPRHSPGGQVLFLSQGFSKLTKSCSHSIRYCNHFW